MKLLSVFALAPIVSAVLAHPLEARQEEYQYLNLTMHSGPISYSMYIPADGQEYATSDFAPRGMYKKH